MAWHNVQTYRGSYHCGAVHIEINPEYAQNAWFEFAAFNSVNWVVERNRESPLKVRLKIAVAPPTVN